MLLGRYLWLLNMQHDPSLWNILMDQHFDKSLFSCSHFSNAPFFFLEGSALNDMVMWKFLPPIIGRSSLSKVGLFEFLNDIFWLTSTLLIGRKNLGAHLDLLILISCYRFFDIWDYFLWMVLLHFTLHNL